MSAKSRRLLSYLSHRQRIYPADKRSIDSAIMDAMLALRDTGDVDFCYETRIAICANAAFCF